MKKILIILGIIILSFIATVLSIRYERTHPTVNGNLCAVTEQNPGGLCYGDLPAGGFPFSYLYDAGEISIIKSLGVEDNFYIGRFIADMIFYLVFFFLIKLLIWRKFVKHQSAN